MTLVPLPDTPCVRIGLIWNAPGPDELGTRLFFSYTGGPPTAADLTTVADDVAAAYAAHLAGLSSSANSLTGVDIIDIASYTGQSGQWAGSDGGSRSGEGMVAQVATNVQYNIARQYRGGKPRGYWPFGTHADLQTNATWQSEFTSAVNAGIEGFITAIESMSEASITMSHHVNLSYKRLFDNVKNSSGRESAVPRYRDVALHDDVVGYKTSALLSSQRRRRTSTSP
jgi:hypothetical protein